MGIYPSIIDLHYRFAHHCDDDFNLLTSYIKNTFTKISGEPIILHSVFDKFAKGKEHLNIEYVSHLFMPETSFKACL